MPGVGNTSGVILVSSQSPTQLNHRQRAIKIVEKGTVYTLSPLLFLTLANETVHTAVYTCV